MASQLTAPTRIFTLEEGKLVDQNIEKINNELEARLWIKENGKENTPYVILQIYRKLSF